MKDDSAELWWLQLPHERIVDLIHVIEGYEGMAVTRVLDKQRGLVELMVAPDLAADLAAVIAGLTEDFPIARVPRPDGIRSIADDNIEP
jgi:hypothetical protein